MNRFFHIATNLVSVLGLILGIALFSSTEAREFVLQNGSMLVMMVFPLTIFIMLLQILFDVDGDGHAVETPASLLGQPVAKVAMRDQGHPENRDRAPLRWG